MKFDAFGYINFKNVTEDDMHDIESLLDRYFLKNEDNDGELNKENNRYLVDTAVDLDTTKEAIRELCNRYRDKIGHLNIFWREDESKKHNSDDKKRSRNYSKRVDFLSEHKEDILRIVMEEESWTLTSAGEVFL